MTFSEAIKTGRPLTRKNYMFLARTNRVFGALREMIMPGTFISPEFLLDNVCLKIEDILADDWIVKGMLDDSDYELVE